MSISRSAKSPDMFDLTISVFVEQSRGCWSNVHDISMQRDIYVAWVPHAIQCIQNVHRNAERSHPLSRLERKSRSAKSPDMLSLTISVFIEESRGCWWSLCLLVVMSRPRLPRWSQGETLGYLHICDSSSDSREMDFTSILLPWLQPMKSFCKGWIRPHRSMLFTLASGTLRISGDMSDGSNMSCNSKCQRVRTCWET